MRSLFRAIFSVACMAAFAGQARARTTEDEQLWVNLTAMGSVSGKLVYFAEVQPRVGDGVSRLDQLLLRGAAGWKLSPDLTFYQGYAHVVLPVEGGRDVNEERSFQQISWIMGRPGGGELSSRTRLEQRWRSNGDDMGWRVRQMLRYEHPLGTDRQKLNALVYGEGFLALNDADWGAVSGFDQLRSFLGAELAIGDASTAEIGYLNQFVNQRGGNSRVNHVASITLFFRH